MTSLWHHICKRL